MKHYVAVQISNAYETDFVPNIVTSIKRTLIISHNIIPSINLDLIIVLNYKLMVCIMM